jgi:hypothetical protein
VRNERCCPSGDSLGCEDTAIPWRLAPGAWWVSRLLNTKPSC